MCTVRMKELVDKAKRRRLIDARHSKVPSILTCAVTDPPARINATIPSDW